MEDIEEKKFDSLWDERKELLKAEEYEGDDDLQCTCHIEGVVCPIHPDRELLKEKELED
jgi:hypothetical protein